MASTIANLVEKSKTLQYDYTALILGLDNAGKTSILRRLTNESSKDIEPTSGFNMKTLKYNQVNLNLKEVGGGEDTRLYWKHYSAGSNGLIWVVDSCDGERVL